MFISLLPTSYFLIPTPCSLLPRNPRRKYLIPITLPIKYTNY
ncbi:hypothetical protein [Moorena sp. SIO3I6]|nr:hypothetical protein [Moorena sp. SIO3I6]